ncbi:uncharacterized protein RBU33_016860 [Hipposideros larvatus]
MVVDIGTWEQIFQELFREVKPRARWTLKLNKDLQPDCVAQGWKQYQQNAFGRNTLISWFLIRVNTNVLPSGRALKISELLFATRFGSLRQSNKKESMNTLAELSLDEKHMRRALILTICLSMAYKAGRSGHHGEADEGSELWKQSESGLRMSDLCSLELLE